MNNHNNTAWSIWPPYRYPHPFLLGSPFKIREYLALVRGVQFAKTDKILDLGCGGGQQTVLLARQGASAIGIDVSEGAVGRARSDYQCVKDSCQCEFRQTTLEAAGFADAAFDKVFSFCVVEHIENYQATLQHCLRILKKGGSLHLTVDSLANIARADLRERHRGEQKVAHYFNRDELAQVLAACGFSNIRVTNLFRGAWAGRLFADGIRRNFQYRLRESLLYAGWLRLNDWLVPSSQPGAFLAAEARK